MILVDTSVWIDHLRVGDRHLEGLLDRALVLGHPWVTGELSLGQLSRRQEVLALLSSLPAATVVTPDEMLGFVERNALHGLGVGYVDVQLLAAARVTPQARLWTRDRRLHRAAEQLGVAADPSGRNG